MTPRDHHFFFAKKMLTTHTFQSPDQMFKELTGPRREAFLMFLWQEAGKGASQVLPHAEVAPIPGGTMPAVVKLDVIGAIQGGGHEVVVISMPPTKAPNEALFVALVRGPRGKSVFFYERCLNQKMDGMSETDAVLAEVRDDQSRSNYGFKAGLGLESFKTYLGEVLGISLIGLERSLAPVTMDAFVGAARAIPQGPPPAMTAGQGGLGELLEKLLLARAALPIAFWMMSFLLGFFGGLWSLLSLGQSLLTLGVIVCLLVWLHQVHKTYEGQTILSPSMAVWGWFIPVGNVFLAPQALAGALKAACGKDEGLAYAWGAFWFLEIVRQVLVSLGFYWAPGSEGGFINTGGASLELPSFFGLLFTFPLSLLIPVGTYGLLWHIVRRVNARV
jgi:hypothetical protein